MFEGAPGFAAAKVGIENPLQESWLLEPLDGQSLALLSEPADRVASGVQHLAFAPIEQNGECLYEFLQTLVDRIEVQTHGGLFVRLQIYGEYRLHAVQ